jgi:hypothetical protein
MNLDPRMIVNPYDALANSFYRWKVMASKDGPSLDHASQGAAAANYYDRILAPLYKRLGTTPMNRDLWLQNAYTEALKYDTADSYHSSLVKGIINGYASGMSKLDRVASTTLNMLGMAFNIGTSINKAIGEGGAAVIMHPSGGITPFYNAVRQIGDGQHSGNFFERAQKDAESIPLYGYVATKVNQLAPVDEFWGQVAPAQGFKEVATSVITEQVMLLPLYKGIGAAIKAVGAVSEGLPLIKNLTAALNSTPVGRKVIPYLIAPGIEGAAVGATLTAPGEDWKREAWQSALGFVAAHSVFSMAGAGIGAGARKAVQLKDIVSGANKEAFDNYLEELELAGKGQHVMSPEEERAAYQKVLSGYVAVSGRQGTLQMFREAVEHLHETKDMSVDEMQEYHSQLLKDDRAHWSPVLNTAVAIQKMLGNAKVGDLDETQAANLMLKFNKMIDDAAEQMPSHVHDVQGMAASAADQISKTPSGQASIARKAAFMKAADAASGMNRGMPDAEYTRRATLWYQKNNVDAAARAAKEDAKEPVNEVQSVDKRRRDIEDPGTTKVRSEYEYGPKGQITGYSLRMGQEYKAYATKAAKAAGFSNMKEWLSDLSQDDFAKDLEEWFYPKDLADGGFYFEHGSDENRPNFLAFMYNYKDFMPKPVADKLEDELISTPTVQKILNGKVDSDRALRYYALQMYNHVDDFLETAQKTHKGEFNIFRSTQSNLLNPTKYQLELHEERIAEERKNLQYMYQKQPELLKVVLGTYDKLAAERYKLLRSSKSFKNVTDTALANSMKRQSLNYRIGDMMTQTGDRDYWRF